MPAVRYCGRTTESDHPPYVYMGFGLAGFYYLAVFAPGSPSSTWSKGFISELGPVNYFSNFEKFGAPWCKNRGVACLYLVPMS